MNKMCCSTSLLLYSDGYVLFLQYYDICLSMFTKLKRNNILMFLEAL